MTLVAIFITVVFLLCLVSGRLERTIVTAPIVFTGAGMAAFLCLPGLRDRQTNLELLLQIAEAGFKDAPKQSVEFTEQWGQVFNFSVFLLFGLLVARDWRQFNARHAVYALLSLTIVRMLPVAIALIGTRLSRATVLFMGWFGPRGLASMVLGLVYLQQHTHQSGESTIRLAVMVTVLLSIFAYGLSALPGMEIYARKISALPPAAAELEAFPAKIRALTANPARHRHV